MTAGAPPVIHEAFRRRAAAAPAAVAVVDGETELTYGALDAASDHLAAVLAARGVGPGDRVPVLLPRSADLVVALLATLKCGAAYSVLDVEWPPRRVAGLLGQLGSRLVIGRPGRHADLPLPVCSPAETPSTSARRPPGPRPAVGGDAVAAVFFTSGTTGTPKGVLSPHRAAVRLFTGCSFARFRPGTVMPMAAAVPWDGLTLELWSVLVNGGTSVVIDDPYLLPGRLREVIARRRVDTVWLTASLFNLHVDEDLDGFDGLAQVLTGGERLSVPHVRRFLARFPEIRLVNGYGPAETTVFATTRAVVPADCEDRDGIPIGSPVEGTTVTVLDGDRPCPPGEPGELCIGGDRLAAGYLGDPRLTAARFPVVAIEGRPVHVYRSGDRGYVGDDGALRFVGRADRQVKIRGHRVEPGEVEAVAGRVPGVGQAVFVPVGKAGDSFGSAWLVYGGDGGVPVEEARLWDELRHALPRPCLPAAVRHVPDLPVTATGKVDVPALRQRLERLTEPPSPVAGERPQGADPVRREVAAAFSDVLGRDEVPAGVSLFALGGSSLDAGRLCVRLESVLGRAVPVSRVMQLGSVDALSEWLGGSGAEAARTPSVTPRLVTPQVGFWLSSLMDPDDPSNLCLMTWWVEGPLRVEALRAAVADVARRHEALSAAYVLDDDGTAMMEVGAGEPAFDVLPEAAAPEEAWTALYARLTEPLDLERGRVLRAALVRIAGDPRVLFGLAVHHVAFDGRAERLLAAELSTAYAARLAGRAPEFQVAAPGAAAVASEYERMLATVDLDAQRAFWRDRLRALPELAVPPVPRAEAGARGVGCIDRHLSAPELKPWDLVARHHGTTRFVVLLAAHVEALGRLTGQDDIVVGVPTDRRSTRLLGLAVTCLVDMVPCRLVRRSRPTELVAACQVAVREAMAAQDVGVAELVRIAGGRGASRYPLYQAVFALQDADQPCLALEGCAARFTRPDAPAAACELVTEVRPLPAGASINVASRPDRVPGDFARAVADTYVALLRDEWPDFG